MLIQEFLPNPIGKDTDGEYILLLNNTGARISLDGWVLKDEKGKQFSLSGNLDANETLTLPYTETKITLNNNGETVYLINPKGEIAHELGFTGQAQEGRIITETKILTQEQIQEFIEPGLSDIEGILPSPSQEPVISIMVLTGILLSFISMWILKSVEQT
jgi:hypothetical protein